MPVIVIKIIIIMIMMMMMMMHRSCVCVNFIAEHTRAKEDATKVSIAAENSGNVPVTTF